MRWAIKDKELVCVDDENGITRLPAATIWKCFQGGNEDPLPDLSEMGFRCSAKYQAPQLRLVNTDDGPFGKLTLESKSHLGKITNLSDGHKSDHIITNNTWSPLYEGALEEILLAVEDAGAEIGIALNAKQYMTCIRDLYDYSWFICECEFKAKEWSATHMPMQRRPPAKFTATLMDYQVRGSDWLTMMRESGVGVVLGDGMGLGKTIQVIKAICDLLEDNPAAKTLVICPSALVENWAREIEKFTCGLEYMMHRGSDRSRNYRTYTASVMITTYDVARMDAGVLSLVDWDMVVLDEAQFIKNPNSQRTRAIKSITRQTSIAVTGTPFENHMTDIWSLYDFCMPGFLGTVNMFTARYADNEESASELGRVIAPTLLRRRLDDIPNDLPPIVTIPMPIALEPNEAEEYERRKLLYTQQGTAFGAIGNLLSDLAAPTYTDNFLSNLKYEYLDAVVDEVADYGEKIIVFAERKTTIGALERKYADRFPVYILNGSTPMDMRQRTIDEFSAVEGAAMLICNPTVGGTGLNITAANHVFHFSMQWNPAKIDQADARAHRRGQEKTVVVHYPFYASTIEEYMWDKVAKKRALAAEVVVGNKAESNADEIAMALSLSPVSLARSKE